MNRVLCPFPSAGIVASNWHKISELIVCFGLVSSFEKEDFLENSRILSCFIQLKSVVFSLLNIFYLLNKSRKDILMQTKNKTKKILLLHLIITQPLSHSVNYLLSCGRKCREVQPCSDRRRRREGDLPLARVDRAVSWLANGSDK